MHFFIHPRPLADDSYQRPGIVARLLQPKFDCFDGIRKVNWIVLTLVDLYKNVKHRQLIGFR